MGTRREGTRDWSVAFAALFLCAEAAVAKDEAQDFEGMLERMERLLADELATFEELKRGEGGPEGKAAVDLVALMAKTLEKIDVLRREARDARLAADAVRRAGELDAEGRRRLAERVAARIDEMVKEGLEEGLCGGDGAGGTVGGAEAGGGYEPRGAADL